MPVSRKQPRAKRSISYALLTDDTKKLQYFKSHLPHRVPSITGELTRFASDRLLKVVRSVRPVRDSDVKPGEW